MLQSSFGFPTLIWIFGLDQSFFSHYYVPETVFLAVRVWHPRLNSCLRNLVTELLAFSKLPKNETWKLQEYIQSLANCPPTWLQIVFCFVCNSQFLLQLVQLLLRDNDEPKSKSLSFLLWQVAPDTYWPIFKLPPRDIIVTQISIFITVCSFALVVSDTYVCILFDKKLGLNSCSIPLVSTCPLTWHFILPLWFESNLKFLNLVVTINSPFQTTGSFFLLFC